MPKASLWVTIGPADKPGYVLSGHTDTVPVTGQAWTSDPYKLRRHDGRLHARGAVDMKGFLAVCLALAPRMQAAGLATPIHLAHSGMGTVAHSNNDGFHSHIAADPNVRRPTSRRPIMMKPLNTRRNISPA